MSYIRAKLGSCKCATGVADDGDLDRMSLKKIQE